jgi:hypothetical protein
VTRYWIGVASKDHVLRGVAGGFCQFCHGKAQPLKAIEAGDRIVYYSPRTDMRGGETVQGFTAIGRIEDGAPYRADMGGGFVPYRKKVAFFPAQDAPIKPLLPRLSFTKDRKSWGYAFRRGVIGITAADYALIAAAMGVKDATARAALR